MVKAFEIKEKSKPELLKQLEELKEELNKLRIQQVVSPQSTKLNRITEVRKSIARVMTVIAFNERSKLREVYTNKKHIPMDLRTKKTRAIRRALTKEDLSIRTTRKIQLARNYPKRKYALKA